MDKNFSVLMSVYAKEKPEYLGESLDSLLCQTVRPTEIVIVKDGPLTEELDALIASYVEKEPSLYTIVPLPENRGLGLALREGMLHLRYELVARMDSDDVCRPDRFEKQLAAFAADPALDVVGSYTSEFEDTPDKIVSHRTVPVDDAEIKRYQKRRDAFNHPSVMFKKSAVLKAGNYQHCPLMEDTLLWVHMIQAGAKCANIPEDLLYMRIGKGMYERRGGYAYYKKYKAARKQIRDTGYISWFDYISSLFAQFVVAMMPNKLRGFVFKKILHK